MAASTLDGSLTFWHQGLPPAGSKTATTVSGGDFTAWHQGLPSLRLLGASAAPADVLTSTGNFYLPARHIVRVAY
jgi:hypothetical protein